MLKQIRVGGASYPAPRVESNQPEFEGVNRFSHSSSWVGHVR